MANTNFGALLTEHKKVWTRDVWHQARDKSAFSGFVGTSHNSMIHKVTELTKSERGNEAVIHLVPDNDEYDGVVGDNELEGNEVALKAYDEKLTIDQLRQAHSNQGKLNNQATVINFRKEAKEQLSWWLADRIDQMYFLTMAGVDFSQNCFGGVRKSQAGNNLSQLAFNYALAPTSERHLRVVAGGSLAPGDTTVMTKADTLGYEHIVNLNAEVKNRYLRGIKGKGGAEVYHLFITPNAMAKLKLDPDFKENARHAGVRGDSNTLWQGGDSYTVDGLMIHEHRYVPNTQMALEADKWGQAGAKTDGCMGLLCGAQAVGFIDLDAGEWNEKTFNYGNRAGIAFGAIMGMKKLQFKDNKGSADRAVKQDYGVIRVDMSA